MSDKTKTLIYFLCFVGACLVYHCIEEQRVPQNSIQPDILVTVKPTKGDLLHKTAEKRGEEQK